SFNPLRLTVSTIALVISSGGSETLSRMAFDDMYKRFRCSWNWKMTPPYTRNDSNTPSPYSNPWSKTDTVACDFGNHFPSTYTKGSFSAKVNQCVTYLDEFY